MQGARSIALNYQIVLPPITCFTNLKPRQRQQRDELATSGSLPLKTMHDPPPEAVGPSCKPGPSPASYRRSALCLLHFRALLWHRLTVARQVVYQRAALVVGRHNRAYRATCARPFADDNYYLPPGRQDDS